MSPRLILEIVAGLALFGGVLWYNHHEREIGAQQCLKDQQKQAAADVEQGNKAVSDAIAKAVAVANIEKAERDRAAEEERAKLTMEATAAHLKAQDLQRRYEAQLVADKSCAIWSQEKVACALQ